MDCGFVTWKILDWDILESVWREDSNVIVVNMQLTEI